MTGDLQQHPGDEVRADSHDEGHREGYAPRLDLPAVSPPSVPPAESRLRRRAIQVTALVGILVSLGWLAWRIVATIPGADLWLAIPLLLLEVHALATMCLHTVDLWNLDAAPPASGTGTGPRAAVLIPTYNEPEEVLLPTIAAAVALEPAHETWVLDDGRRPWVEELAQALGATYRVRADNRGAKAGNINAVLPDLAERGVEVVGILDADHVAGSDFLTATLPYFADPGIAVVQTPQDFYNVDSFEHIGSGTRRYSEQALFYRAIAPGRNRWGAAFWCGTCAVVRLSALQDVGGVATESVTEDILTTLKMQRRGWRTVYHNAVLAQGLAAANVQQYLTQRLRWGTGAMQVLRGNNPLTGPGLSRAQRVSYMSTLTGWFDAWRTLGFILLPLLTLTSAATPIWAPATVFLPAFAVVWTVQRVAQAALERRLAPLRHALLFEFIRMPANLRATLALLDDRPRPFVVTSKGRDGLERERMEAPLLLLILLGATPLVLAWAAFVLSGAAPVRYEDPWIAYGSAFWALVNAALLAMAVLRVTAPRFGANRRAAVRFDLTGRALLDGRTVDVRDVSLTGARVLCPQPGCAGVGRQVVVSLPVSTADDPGPEGVGDFLAVVRLVQPTDAGDVIGLEFIRPDRSAQAALALALFRTGITPRLEPALPDDGVQPPMGEAA